LSSKKLKQGYKLEILEYSKKSYLPIEWDVKKINKVCKITSGSGFPIKYQKGDAGEIPFIKVSDMNHLEGRIYATKSKNSITKSIAKKIKSRICSKDTVIFPKIGATIFTHKRAILKKDSCFDNNIVGLIPEKIFSKFLYYVMDFIRLENFCQITALPYLDDKIVGNLKIQIPKLTEQQRISSILFTVDSLISSHDEIIETTKELKKGLMQQLLTKGIDHKKFKKIKWFFGKEIEIPEEWKTMKLSSLSTLITKGSSPNWQGFEYVDKGVLFITSENVGTNKIILKNKKYLNPIFNQSQKRSILQKGDVLTNIVGASIGRSAFFDVNEIANINQAVALIRLNQKVSSKFIVHYLNWNVLVKFLIHGTGETARPNLSLQNVGNIPVLFPTLIEQQKITTILDSIDFDVLRLESKKTHLEKLKKGLMEKLLTGQIRV
jgi:type I restriction enzyme, S subunit